MLQCGSFAPQGKGWQEQSPDFSPFVRAFCLESGHMRRNANVGFRPNGRRNLVDAGDPIAYLRGAASQQQRSGRVGRPRGGAS